MSEQKCQWCGAAVKTRFCQPDTGFAQMILFRCDVEYYPQELEAAWPRRPTLKCGQRCAEQMRQLREVNENTVTLAQLQRVQESANWGAANNHGWLRFAGWRIIAESVSVMIDSVTKGA